MNSYKAIGEIKNPDKYSDYYSKLEQLEQQHQINLAKIKSDAVVSDIDNAVAQVDPVQALQNENARKLALIQEFENQKWITEQNTIALREAANHQYEQNRINAQWEIWRNQSDANEFLASSLEGLANSATSTISGLVSGTMTATQAMQNFANVILNEAIGSLVQMGMQYVKNAIVAQSTSAATTATQITSAEALAIAYQPAAMLASIATQGTAATIGAESYITALGTMKAFSIAGARKNGGSVAANSMYRVGEGNKPEILMQGGRQYLIPGENGQVLSNRQINSDNGNNIQWNFIVQNYASNVEESQPSIDVEKKIIRMAVKESKQMVAGDINNHSGDVWNALNNSTNIHQKQETYYTLTQEEIDNSHPEKLPNNYKSLIHNFFTTALKDPDSAKYIFYKPVRAYSASTKTVFWMVRVDVNAKNSYGGYTGYKPFLFARKTDGGIMEITPLFSMTKVVVVDSAVQEK